jgi:hypothetical protein
VHWLVDALEELVRGRVSLVRELAEGEVFEIVAGEEGKS